MMVQIKTVPVTAFLATSGRRWVRIVVLSLLRLAVPGIWVTRTSLALAVYGYADRAEHESIKVAIWRLRHEDGIAIETRVRASGFRGGAYRLMRAEG